MPSAKITARAGETSPDAGHAGHPHPSGGGGEAVATGGALVACVVGQLPRHVVDAGGIRAWGLALVVAVAVVSGVRAVARAPFTLHRSLHDSSDRAGALRRWARTESTTIVVTTVAGTAVGLPLYLLIRNSAVWWLAAGLFTAGATLLWQLAGPLAIAVQAGPLTAAPAPLGDRVRALAALAGVAVGDGVVVAGKPGARRCNAYVVGLGRTRRVVLESAVATWPPDLLDQVVAHELGHWRLGHTARRLPFTLACQLGTLAAAAAVLSFRPLLDRVGIAGAGDPLSYPVLLAVGAGVALPARCLLAWRDRSQERAADNFAIDLLDRPDHFVAMLHRAADESGIPLRLPWWRRLTASHPPVNERTLAVLAKGT